FFGGMPNGVKGSDGACATVSDDPKRKRAQINGLPSPTKSLTVCIQLITREQGPTSQVDFEFGPVCTKKGSDCAGLSSFVDGEIAAGHGGGVVLQSDIA